MFMNDVDSDLVSGITHQMPLILVSVAGMIFAMILWRRQPLACGLVLTGSALLLLVQLIHISWECIFIPELEAQGAIPSGIDELILYGLPYLAALGIALILAAAFVGRREGRRLRDMLDDDA